ncbi:hypothetical protein R3P38DRAFT_2679244 [Favolaschia claudopus]|uniref:mRNA-decapping enzyme 1B n=1 Tax=Favolaschia claudopus TaxID=2862362 RepID=A0AAW0E6U1_9AGAR
MSRRRPPSRPHSTMYTPSPTLNGSPAASRAQHRPQQSQSAEQQPTNLGMSPQARYNHNLKVLRRRDPSIITIFDQFSHVCVYHHNGQTWEKNGFEGSMFLYERDSYPPYGLYILNRMGMDDYIQRLYPEDIAGIHGTYCMIRSYSDFTNRRISSVLSSHTEVPHKFSDAWAIPNLESLTEEDKGRFHTVGLWMFPTDAREPMLDVMMRLHSYVKLNVPYPEQFRYGPNRPPPPNPHLRTSAPSPPPQQQDETPDDLIGDNSLALSFPTETATELDQLFARMRTFSSPIASPTSPPAASPPSSRRTGSTITVASLFASINGNASATPPPTTAPGISLLDTIFASAAANPTPAPPIHSPTPAVAPQILNHEVITTLLGLPPSRSASAASMSYSSDAFSLTSSQEGDNEYEESGSGGGGLGPAGSDGYPDQAHGRDSQVPVGGRHLGGPTPRTSTRSLPVNGTGTGAAKVTNGKGRAHGDVTPRGQGPPPPGVHANGHSKRAPVPVPPPMESVGSTSTIRGAVLSPSFAAGSDLWPGVVDDTSFDADGPAEEGEIVELDFADTSALSDPDVFRQVQQRARRMHDHNGEDANRIVDADRGSPASGGRERRDRGKGRKKGRRERAAERAVERSLEATRLLQIMDSSSVRERLGLPASSSSSRSASASPSPERMEFHNHHPQPVPVAPSSTSFVPAPSMSVVAQPKMANGYASTASTAARVSPPTANINGLDPVAARNSVVSTLAHRLPAMEKNAFMRELLTLIHTDKTFVDALWQDYTTRTE